MHMMRAGCATHTHDSGGRIPTWNAMVGFAVLAGVVVPSVNVQLRVECALGDRDGSRIRITLSEMFSGAPDGPIPGELDAFRGSKIKSSKPHGAALNHVQ
jgi:hypothetical protein